VRLFFCGKISGQDFRLSDLGGRTGTDYPDARRISAGRSTRGGRWSRRRPLLPRRLNAP